MSILGTLQFEPLFITEVFESMVAAGGWFDLVNAKQDGTAKYPYVARSGGSNGIGGFLPFQGTEPPNPGNALTIGVSTSTVFYQPVPFYTSKEIQVLRHEALTPASGLVLVTILRQQMGKFQWGNGASLARLKATKIMVPVQTDENGGQKADWAGMETLGNELNNVVRTRASTVLGAFTTSVVHEEESS